MLTNFFMPWFIVAWFSSVGICKFTLEDKTSSQQYKMPAEIHLERKK